MADVAPAMFDQPPLSTQARAAHDVQRYSQLLDCKGQDQSCTRQNYDRF